MSEPPSEPLKDPTDRPATTTVESPEPIVALPSWVPVAIGLILVSFAGLAVYTGLTYRGPSLAKRFLRRGAATDGRLRGSGAPGEPQPGASRVLHGASGEMSPRANPLEENHRSRVTMSGDRGGTIATVRMAARRGILVRVAPDDTIVYVNNEAIGLAKQFSTTDQIWEFPPDAEEGSFTVRLVAPGHRELEYIVSARKDASDEIARIETALVPVQ